MTIEALTEADKIALAADWVELVAMLSFRQSCSKADLVRSLSVLEESEHDLVDLTIINDEDTTEKVEEEILQSKSELWASDVREELATRSTNMATAYPFRIADTGSTWRLIYQGQPDRQDHLFYSCCLLITGRRHSLIRHQVPEMDKVLQVIAYLVAGRIVEGTAYWFGYPRPDHTGMADAVKELLRCIGFDSPSLVRPVWSIGTENDAGIDVVAWRNFGDRLPSRVVVYGQVASGKNWEDKPVDRYVPVFRDWLGNYGQQYYVPAIFIPWQQYVHAAPTRERSFRQRVLDLSIRNEKTLGLTVDRGRIAELATKTIRTGNNDEAEWIQYLVDWRTTVLAIVTEQPR